MAGYNGWTNYETWNAALWMDNDEGTQDRWRETAEECWNEAEADNVLSKEDRAEVMLADRLKDEIEEGNPLAGACTMYADILTANLSEIDYLEIARNWLEDVDKDDDDEETTKDEVIGGNA